jgi:hypothetical protein
MARSIVTTEADGSLLPDEAHDMNCRFFFRKCGSCRAHNCAGAQRYTAITFF